MQTKEAVKIDDGVSAAIGFGNGDIRAQVIVGMLTKWNDHV